MLIIDTFARSAVGIDENDARDVGLRIDAVTRLQAEMQVNIVAVHHSQKTSRDDRKGQSVRERGSSAFIGAVDTVIRLTKDGSNVKVACEKQKDAGEFSPFTLALKVVNVGQETNGQLASSCVLVDPEIVESGPTLSTDHRRLLTILTGFDNRTAARSEWFARSGTKPRTFDRHLNELKTANYIESPKRGIYTITAAGLLAIANELPPFAMVG
jgi:hypothetical protein